IWQFRAGGANENAFGGSVQGHKRQTPMTFARIILAIQILILGGVGMAYWVRPYEMANLNGLLLMESISVINVRVWLGGLQVGLALFLGWTLRDRASIRSGLMLVMLLQ